MTEKTIVGTIMWRLEMAIREHPGAEDEKMHFRPRLLLLRRTYVDEGGADALLGFVERDIGDAADHRSAWLAYHYPKDSQREARGSIFDQRREGFYPIVEAGEERQPRQSAKAAVDVLLKEVSDQVSRGEMKGLTSTVEFLLKPLEDVTKAYVRRLGQRRSTR